MDEKQRQSSVDVEHLARLIPGCVQDIAMVMLDVEGRIIAWSAGAEVMFGHRQAEVLQEPLHILFTPEDIEQKLPEQELRVAAKIGRAQDDRWHVRKDSTAIWVSGVLTALREEGGELVGFIKIMRDRTDLKSQLETLENRVMGFMRLEDSRRTFVGKLAHELRNPLAPLVNSVRLIRLTLPENHNLDYPLDTIERQVDSLRALIADLSDVTRVGTGKVRLDLKPVALHVMLGDAVETCRISVEERGHSIEVFCPPAPVTVEADRERVHQVLVNLITNAAKYTPDGGKIWVEATVDEHDAILVVRDNGRGISPEMLPNIFTLFTQEESSLDRSDGGLGIGLALVKDLVSMHNGSVSVRSAGHGHGSEFSVRLPLRQPPQSE